jgi:lipoate-protein ligase A
MPSWRLLKGDVYNSFENMAIDEAILETRIENRIDNTIRFYQWNPSAVSIGRFQDTQREVELENCREHGVHVVRRISGGGAVYHDSDYELTYSVVAKQEDLGSYDVAENYRLICNGLIEGIRSLGLEADYSRGDRRNCPNVTVKGRKISGSAQAIRKGTILQHGTLLINVDLTRMFKFLKVSTSGNCADWKHRVDQKITSLTGELGYSPSLLEIEKVIIQGFKRVLKINLIKNTLSEAEFRLADQLRAVKFSTELWNLEGKFST